MEIFDDVSVLVLHCFLIPITSLTFVAYYSYMASSEEDD